MKKRITIEPATLAHADFVAAHMRPSDVREVLASHGHNPFEAARGAVMVSRFAYCGLVDGVPAYLFGMRDGTAVNRTGFVWGLGTQQASRHAKTFWPASRNFIAFCRGHVDRLENFVDCRNAVSIAWLKRLGFAFDAPAPYGVEGRPFMRFGMEGGFLNV